MDISILFNWPPVQDSATVSFSGSTAEDMKHEFRVGIIKKEENKDAVYWLKPEWVGPKNMYKIKFVAKIDEKIIVEKKESNDEKIITRHIWDIRKEWPPEARGPSSTNVPWTFH